MDKSTVILRELAQKKVQAMTRADLERAYLELREAADALADIFENVACFKVEDRDKAMQALAAHRKATQ